MKTINGNYKKYKLNNGLVVALQNTPTQTIFGQLTVDYGTVHEEKGQEGLAHFLEHVLFKGENKYNIKESNKIKSRLGYFNAFTSINQTYFPGEMLSEYLESYLDIVSSILSHPKFDKLTIEQERQRILREMSDEKGDPIYKDKRLILEKTYGKNHPTSLKVSGKEEVVKKIEKKDLKNFHSKGYGAKNMQLVLAGGLPDNTEKLIEKYFRGIKSGKNTKFNFPLMNSLDKKILIHSYAPDLCNQKNPDESNSYINLGIIVPPDNHKDSIALGMLSYILGGGADSRLFKKISQEKGLAYKINSSYGGDFNRGIIEIDGNVYSKNQDKAIELIFKEFEKLQKNPIDNNELEIKKRVTKYGLTKLFETNEGHKKAIRVKLEDGITTPKFILSETEKLTSKKIQEVAIKYLPKSREDNGYALLIRDPLKK